jgi:hypothetical protein
MPADGVGTGWYRRAQFLEAGLSDDAIITHIDGRIMTAFIRADTFAAVVKGRCGSTHNSERLPHQRPAIRFYSTAFRRPARYTDAGASGRHPRPRKGLRPPRHRLLSSSG